MGGMPRMRRALVLAALLVVTGGGTAMAQTAGTGDAKPIELQPTAQCPQSDIDQLQRVITFVQSKSWAENPGDTSFLISPDTATCRVVVKIAKVSSNEEAALQAGGQGRLAIERTKDKAKPSRLPLLLWIVFGGAGLVFVFARYGRR